MIPPISKIILAVGLSSCGGTNHFEGRLYIGRSETLDVYRKLNDEAIACDNHQFSRMSCALLSEIEREYGRLRRMVDACERGERPSGSRNVILELWQGSPAVVGIYRPRSNPQVIYCTDEVFNQYGCFWSEELEEETRKVRQYLKECQEAKSGKSKRKHAQQ